MPKNIVFFGNLRAIGLFGSKVVAVVVGVGSGEAVPEATELRKDCPVPVKGPAALENPDCGDISYCPMECAILLAVVVAAEFEPFE